MIKYKLLCKSCDFSFDSWFASSREFEKLKKQKFLICHMCESSKVEKTLMSPSILKTKNTKVEELENNKYKKIKKTIFEYQKFIKTNFKYVGENFSYEARSLHYQSKKNSKGIYGIATKNDLKELKEEGIETEIVPWLDDKNN
jgi:hypothetical protein